MYFDHCDNIPSFREAIRQLLSPSPRYCDRMNKGILALNPGGVTFRDNPNMDSYWWRVYSEARIWLSDYIQLHNDDRQRITLPDPAMQPQAGLHAILDRCELFQGREPGKQEPTDKGMTDNYRDYPPGQERLWQLKEWAGDIDRLVQGPTVRAWLRELIEPLVEQDKAYQASMETTGRIPEQREFSMPPDDPCDMLTYRIPGTRMTRLHAPYETTLPALGSERAERQRQAIMLVGIHDHYRQVKISDGIWAPELLDRVWQRMKSNPPGGPPEDVIKEALNWLRTKSGEVCPVQQEGSHGQGQASEATAGGGDGPSELNANKGSASPPPSQHHVSLNKWRKSRSRNLMQDLLEDELREGVNIRPRRHGKNAARELRQTLKRHGLSDIANAVEAVEGEVATVKLNIPHNEITWASPQK